MALETAMIAIVDRLIQLVKTRQEDKRKLFVDHIEPLFADLSQVHANYLAAFEELLELASQADYHDHEAVFQAAMRKKAALEHLRVKAHAIAAIDRGNLPQEAGAFFELCKEYFDVAAGGARVGYYGYFSRFLEAMEKEGPNRINANHIRLFVDDFISILRSKWDAMTQAYAEARTKLL